MFALNTKKQNKQEVEEKSLANQGGEALGVGEAGIRSRSH